MGKVIGDNSQYMIGKLEIDCEGNWKSGNLECGGGISELRREKIPHE